MIERRMKLALSCLALATPLAHAGLEIPAQGSVQSGIGLVSGWTCDAARVEILIDGFAPMAAAARTPRGDTAGVCGRTDTGFALLFNYNALRPGLHTITVLADSRFVGGGTFQVAHAGEEYATGRRARVVVNHFPSLGDRTTVAWDEEKQNFSIVEVTRISEQVPASVFYNGTYYGAAHDVIRNAFQCGPVPPNPERAVYPGTFKVLMDEGSATLDALLADGRSCRATGPLMPGYSGFGGESWSGSPGTRYALLQSSCREFSGMAVALDGERISSTGTNDCATYSIRAIR